MNGQGDGATGSVVAPEPPPPSARFRLNLIEQVTADTLASDYAGAPPDRPESSRRQRLLVAAAALGVAGVVLALGVSARVINAPAVAQQRQALLERIEEQETRQEEAVAVTTRLREEVEAARRAELELVLGGEAIADRVQAYEIVTGYAAVTGPGLVVTLQDAPPDPESERPELERVLDSDIQRAVNGLWLAGAEAVAVNNQRLTARSAIRSASGAILVNYRPLRPPYLVQAIGPASMAEAFQASADAAYLRDISEQYGIGFTLDEATGLRLPAATTALPSEAEVIEPEGVQAP